MYFLHLFSSTVTKNLLSPESADFSSLAWLLYVHVYTPSVRATSSLLGLDLVTRLESSNNSLCADYMQSYVYVYICSE